jgi:hypothetical protein
MPSSGIFSWFNKVKYVAGAVGIGFRILLHNLYSSPSIIRMTKSRKIIRAGHVAQMGEKRNAYRILVRNPEGKRPLGRPR